MLWACALAGSACGEEPAASQCVADAGALPTVVEVMPGGFCASRRLSVPNRAPLDCEGYTSAIGGTQVSLRGHPETHWTLAVERTDGSPDAVCTGVLDPLCRCARAACARSDEPLLIVDLGTVETEQAEVILPAGTYSVELCTR